MKVRDVIRELEANGWVHTRTHSSHRIFKKDGQANNVSVPGKDNDDLKVGTYQQIKKAAGIK